MSPARPAEYPAACRALFAHLPAVDRIARVDRALALIANGEIDPTGLLVARDMPGADVLVGAMLVQHLPGSAASVWVPRAVSGPNQRAVEDALARAAVARLRAGGARYAQSFLKPEERLPARALELVGFRFLTQLAFLIRDLTPEDARPNFDAPVRFVTYSAIGPNLFADVLLATYEDSRDCPELNGTRSASEIVAEYRTEAPSPPPWWLVEAGDGGPVGVVILSPKDGTGVWDLSYLGLIPRARDRGWGKHLLRYAVARASLAGAVYLNLSADARNEPALRLYQGHGFRQYDLQDVFWWRGAG
ncbi:GNAT family N-acetyltransferase [Fimbriiglobus ruber]|uniref:N-acetyltransferase domain-containing protein n=1 Tax=Fimbriiglobus ruber TaxID=1908690 RepID=A0A225DPW4_9BACT|nr:GNAT family N-acetyltransferase [Fimbriiglobus ruber]OWK43341.1 hypothetical protein FRUB_02940 [Fimbriiglobus ruber]